MAPLIQLVWIDRQSVLCMYQVRKQSLFIVFIYLESKKNKGLLTSLYRAHQVLVDHPEKLDRPVPRVKRVLKDLLEVGVKKESVVNLVLMGIGVHVDNEDFLEHLVHRGRRENWYVVLFYINCHLHDYWIGLSEVLCTALRRRLQEETLEVGFHLRNFFKVCSFFRENQELEDPPDRLEIEVQWYVTFCHLWRFISH